MRSTSGTESARRMAHWRATGGAGDGLGAAGYTGRYGIACGTDDGLAAVSATSQYGHVCIADDGLKALWATSRATCQADDGLTPRMGTAGGAPSTLCAADDGFTAGA